MNVADRAGLRASSPLLEQAGNVFAENPPAADRWTLRLVEERTEGIAIRQGVLLPPQLRIDRGALITVVVAGGSGYAATSDLSAAGLQAAAQRARRWAEASAGRSVVAAGALPRPRGRGHYETPVSRPWEALPLPDRIALLQQASEALKVDGRIVDWAAGLWQRRRVVLLTSSDGARLSQRFDILHPTLSAVANQGTQTQVRTGGGLRQGGLEQLGALGFPNDAPRIAAEAIALLEAPECPTGRLDLVLLPKQMALQIHESIGHPLELDRILGDERNYAGTSFVTPEMFGSYRYGSALLNVTFDPALPEEVGSYAYDDEGGEAKRAYLIRNGILERPLGGACSQARSTLPGVANARASDWFRPPIDRMANLNLEPGDQSLERLVAGVERGVLMDTNRSWSIDDSRNKFQFGCELGRLIVDGELRHLVRNPNYRGVSATFWRSLDGVGDRSTYAVEGVGSCGKGEPNQMVQVGHASPACRFRDVEVFGGGG